ncbi:MAG: Uma2 family endonuclease [Polyangiaceae bacterium]|nr:Uma2 family endonuclease [Polyangiaceae bacterium]
MLPRLTLPVVSSVPVTCPANPKTTYNDLMRVPEHLVAEIIDGVLYSQPRPAPRHSRTSFALMGHLAGPFDFGINGPGGWIILNGPELHLGSDVIVSDIAGWRCERMVDVPESSFVDIAPDWVCEILSPRTQTLDRTRKMVIYAREGVKNTWLVDPIEQTQEVYRLHTEGWLRVAMYHGDAVVRAVPFDAIEIKLATLWWVSSRA